MSILAPAALAQRADNLRFAATYTTDKAMRADLLARAARLDAMAHRILALNARQQ